jgi:hypothetical protein
MLDVRCTMRRVYAPRISILRIVHRTSNIVHDIDGGKSSLNCFFFTKNFPF